MGVLQMSVVDYNRYIIPFNISAVLFVNVFLFSLPILSVPSHSLFIMEANQETIFSLFTNFSCQNWNSPYVGKNNKWKGSIIRKAKRVVILKMTMHLSSHWRTRLHLHPGLSHTHPVLLALEELSPDSLDLDTHGLSDWKWILFCGGSHSIPQCRMLLLWQKFLWWRSIGVPTQLSTAEEPERRTQQLH